jgi:hypothetical protein
MVLIIVFLPGYRPSTGRRKQHVQLASAIRQAAGLKASKERQNSLDQEHIQPKSAKQNPGTFPRETRIALRSIRATVADEASSRPTPAQPI